MDTVYDTQTQSKIQTSNDMATNVNNNINSEKSCNKKIKKNKHQSCNNKKNFNLTVLHWNCNGLKSKIDELETYLLSKRPDIVSLNELKCNNNEATVMPC